MGCRCSVLKVGTTAVAIVYLTSRDNSFKPSTRRFLSTSQREALCHSVPNHYRVYVTDGWKYDAFSRRCRKLMDYTLVQKGIPGIIVSVMVDGRYVFNEGHAGYADVENSVLCSEQTIMRIASISKTLTAVALMQLVEQKLIDLDVPIQMYLPHFPAKTYHGSTVTITARQILSHSSGIRHYNESTSDSKISEIKRCREYYNKDYYEDVKSSMELFVNDDLVCKPGFQFHYTTYGYTVISALIESVSGMPFLTYMHHNLLNKLAMDTVQPEYNNKLIKHRSRYYVRDDRGNLENASYVDNSYKWAGGGFISTAIDLAKFGNALLILYQLNDEPEDGNFRKPYLSVLKPSTVKSMWDICIQCKSQLSHNPNSVVGFGLGWKITKTMNNIAGGRDLPLVISHSGSAVGASSLLSITPQSSKLKDLKNEATRHTININSNGIVVAIICNLQDVKLSDLGADITKLAYDIFYCNCDESI